MGHQAHMVSVTRKQIGSGCGEGSANTRGVRHLKKQLTGRGSKPGYTPNAKGLCQRRGGLPTNASGWQTPSGGTRTFAQRTYDLKKGGDCQLWVCGTPPSPDGHFGGPLSPGCYPK